MHISNAQVIHFKHIQFCQLYLSKEQGHMRLVRSLKDSETKKLVHDNTVENV